MTHIVNGEFQSDKYPTCPPGKVPLSVHDEAAQDLLWAYAQRRRRIDAEFSDDLESALKTAGFRRGPRAGTFEFLLPRRNSLVIEYQPHLRSQMPAAEWLRVFDVQVDPSERVRIERADELWVVWYSPVESAAKQRGSAATDLASALLFAGGVCMTDMRERILVSALDEAVRMARQGFRSDIYRSHSSFTSRLAMLQMLARDTGDSLQDAPARAKTFYLASSRDGRADVDDLAAFLTDAGMVNAFDWPTHFGHQCSAGVCGIRNRAELRKIELRAAGTCDLFVGINRMGKGTHVELGAALTGSAKRIILVGVDPDDSCFYDPEGVDHFATVADVMKSWAV